MKNFFNNLELKFQRFMIGRYGTDQLYKGLLVIYLICILLSFIIQSFIHNNDIAMIPWYLGTVILIFAFYRVFSKKTDVRQQENRNWLRLTGKLKKRMRLIKDMWKFRKTHLFKTCPQCGSVLRLPKHRGILNVSCPHCRKAFRVKTGKKKKQAV